MIRRSVFCLSVGIAIVGAPLSLAQTQRVARVGVLANFPPSDSREAAGWEGWQTFSEEMKRLGWEEGRNLVIERRFGMNDPQTRL